MKTHTDVDNGQDVIDSRDVIARIEELESEQTDLKDAIDAANQAHGNGVHQDIVDAHAALADWNSDNEDELKALQSLADEASGSPDWTYGETLIRDSYFTRYAEQLADDLGYTGDSKTSSWPFTCIDWEQAARELQQDYMQVDFDGVEYWIRA